MTGKQLREAWIRAVERQTEFLQKSASEARREGFSMAEYRQREKAFQREVQATEHTYRDWQRAVCAKYEHFTLNDIREGQKGDN